VLDDAGLADVLSPRDDLVEERAAGGLRFEAVSGPVRRYERTVRVDHRPDGRYDVTETTDFALAMSFWGLAVVPLFKRALTRRWTAGRQPWWAPPQRLDARAAHVLGVLCTASLIAGYLTTLLTQTITFAADEFDVGDRGQGIALAGVRISVLLSIAVVALADRRGRRRLVVISAGAGCVAAAVAALSPSLPWLVVTMGVERGFATALGLLVLIVAAEEMPKGARAYAISVLAMPAALGAGMCLWALPLADLGDRGWRLVYVIPLLFLFLLRTIGRTLPESRRFVAKHPDVSMAGHGRRFWLLAAVAFLLDVFAAPAGQFQNEFLRDERGFSAAQISLFVIATNTPGVIGLIAGGRLADQRGRRRIGAAAVVGGTVTGGLMFLSSGWTLWAWSLANAILGAAIIPALGVYGAELFPTSLRGRAKGLLSGVGVLGSAVGLVAAGFLSDSLGELGPAIAILAIAPLAVAAIVLLAFPETANRELEELNPEDRAPAVAS
jgi:MFS family permease